MIVASSTATRRRAPERSRRCSPPARTSRADLGGRHAGRLRSRASRGRGRGRRRRAVVPIPGPSAVLAALVAAGLPTDRFMFLGLPAARERRAPPAVRAACARCRARWSSTRRRCARARRSPIWPRCWAPTAAPASRASSPSRTKSSCAARSARSPSATRETAPARRGHAGRRGRARRRGRRRAARRRGAHRARRGAACQGRHRARRCRHAGGAHRPPAPRGLSPGRAPAGARREDAAKTATRTRTAKMIATVASRSRCRSR